MKKKNILVLVGTRPEAIKLAPVIHALMNEKNIDVHVCVSGQQKELTNHMLEFFNIKAQTHFELDIIEPSLANISSSIMNSINNMIIDRVDRPKDDICFRDYWRNASGNFDAIIAQGDTTTVFIAALTAFYNRIPFFHVEAGLRTNNIYSPFPEEVFRRFASIVAELNFAPTEMSKQALLKENVPEDKIFVTGNTVVDALKTVAKVAKEPSQELGSVVDFSKNIVLVTTHRREAYISGQLREICEAVQEIAKKYQKDNVEIVVPVHPNNNVKAIVEEMLSGIDNIKLMKPFSYEDMIYVIKHSKLILSDSGGIQEEAASLGVPLIVLRDHTERMEGVVAGSSFLSGTSKENILNIANRLLPKIIDGSYEPVKENPYGDGHSSEQIVSIIKRYFNINE